LDQRLEDRLVDLPQPHDTHAGAKRVEDANVGCAMAIAQVGEIPPRALLGQQPGQQVERTHRRQERQQMHAPELGRTELPARAADGPHVPTVVDEVVGNVWIQQVEQLVGSGDRKAIHGARAYLF
jgi:hypothetical protein